MAPDTGLLTLAAGLLATVAVARVASAGARASLAAFAGDALLGLALAGAVLLAVGVSLELGVLYFGAAALAGLYWTGMAERRPRLGGAGLVVSALAAAVAVASIVAAARFYQWWFAPLGLLLAMGAGLAAQGLGWLLRAPQPAAASATAPTAPKPAPPSPAPPKPQPGPGPQAAPAKVAIVCASCGLRGMVAAQGPPTLKCPRCGAPVQRPASASPPPGGAPATRTRSPPPRGPSS